MRNNINLQVEIAWDLVPYDAQPPEPDLSSDLSQSSSSSHQQEQSNDFAHESSAEFTPNLDSSTSPSSTNSNSERHRRQRKKHGHGRGLHHRVARWSYSLLSFHFSSMMITAEG